MESEVQRVKVVDFDMSITSLIWLFVKMSIASIPAFIILWVMGMVMALIAVSVLGIGGAALSSG